MLARERFDVLHLHEPMTPAICVAALALAPAPMVGDAATPPASSAGCASARPSGASSPIGSTTVSRSPSRRAISAARWLPGEYEVIPNGVLIPDDADPGGREHRIVFAGRQEPRKGMQVLLRAWPEIRRRTGARLRVVGADPLAVRLLLTRLRRSGRGDRHPRLPQPGGPDRRAARGEGAGRAVARRRELRHGADARLRLRDAGRRLRHHRLPRRHDARDGACSSRPAIRTRSRTPSRRCSRTSRAGARSARRRGELALERVRLGGHRAPARWRSTRRCSRR